MAEEIHNPDVEHDLLVSLLVKRGGSAVLEYDPALSRELYNIALQPLPGERMRVSVELRPERGVSP